MCYDMIPLDMRLAAIMELTTLHILSFHHSYCVKIVVAITCMALEYRQAP